MQPETGGGAQKRHGVGRSLTTYEASAVKWADGCTTGVDWPSVKHIVNRLCQAIAADLISIAGHST